jgi:hypothetical protein
MPQASGAEAVCHLVRDVCRVLSRCFGEPSFVTPRQCQSISRLEEMVSELIYFAMLRGAAPA